MKRVTHGLAQAALATTCLFGLAAAQAQTATLEFRQGVAGFTGTADTYLRGVEPDRALGGDGEASVDASDGGLPAHALLRFDGLFGTAAGQIQPGWTIVQASLTLQISSAGSGLMAHHMLSPWSQASASWNSLVDGISPDGIEAQPLPFLSLGANTSNAEIGEGPLVLDLTAALRAQQAGQVPGHGWALLPFMPGGTNGLDFLTSESPLVNDRPLLSVTVAAVPEPGVAWMAISGGLMLLGMRRLQRR